MRQHELIEHPRRTKIVATLGPATDGDGVVDDLIAAGMDAARLNCSHGGREDLERRAHSVREAATRLKRPVALLFDLQGPKIRLASDTPERTLALGEQGVFTGPDGAPGNADALKVAFAGFTALLTERSSIVVGDGTPRLAVLQRGAKEVLAMVTS